LNFFSKLLVNRAVSLFQFMGAPKITNIINGLLEQIPDEIPIPNTDVYLQGGLTNEFHSVKQSYISFPLDFVIQSERGPLTGYPKANFSDVTVSKDYETQAYISAHFLQSVFQTLYVENLIQITTNTLSTLEKRAMFFTVGTKNMNEAGYTVKGGECRILLTIGDEITPKIDITEATGLGVNATLHIQM